MKENIINYKGIKTNNLKNIDVDIPKECFWGIAGPSGSGKSSLAYGTIFAISQYEWEKVSNIPAGIYVNFKVDSYKNVIPSIALKQDNYNSNPRSTIATYLRIDKDFRLLFAAENNVSPSIFSFNNPKNACLFCGGLGVENVINDNQLIDWDKSILEKPFNPWHKGYYQKLLEKYATAKEIPLNLKLSDLTEKQIDLLLYNMTEEKYSVSYKANGKSLVRKFRYVGLMEEFDALQNDKQHISSAQKMTNFSSLKVCSHCHGSRFADKVDQYKFNGKSLGEIYLMEFCDLDEFIKNSIDKATTDGHRKLLNNIHRILKELINGKLEYLNLNRSIPTLSGGELQRIRLVNILTSQIEGMMYIIDEPSARLHVSEYDSIISDFRKLKDAGNIVLMIEHNPYFLRMTDKNIFIGPSSGDDGGYLMKEDAGQNCIYKYAPRECNEFIHFDNISENNLQSVNVDIPRNRITGIYGPSGSGKSTLAMNIEIQHKSTEYISQKALRGSKASTIASYSGISDLIRAVFAASNKVTADYFSFKTEKGQCPICKGKGEITYELDFGKTKVDIICDECKGMRFNSEALLFTYKGKSIYEVLNLTIDHLVKSELFDDVSINKQLINLRKMGLGYLTLFRTTDTLSGGEAQRLKLIKFIGKRLNDKLFIFDEPLRGLSRINAFDILSIFNDITKKGGTVVFIEHNVLGLFACDYLIEMGPGKGKNGGKVIFNGEIETFKKSVRWNVYSDKA